MRKKLREKAGLTMVEMLVATAVLLLLVLMLGTGLQMMFNTYQTMIARSEVELLLSTAVDALADDLRYAWDVERTGDTVDGDTVYSNFTYSSDSFEGRISLGLKEGRIVANNTDTPAADGKRVLPTGAYGSGAVMSYKEYKVTEMKVILGDLPAGTRSGDVVELTFTIHLTVETADGKISAVTPEDGVTIRCLNKVTVT